MENNTQLPVEVERQIEKEAEAHNARLKEHAESEKDEAYAQGFAEGWGEGATAYAKKLHQVEQENIHLNRWKAAQIALFEPLYDYGMASKEIRLGESIVTFILNRCKEYDKMKQQATGWRPLLEEVLRRFSGISEAGGQPEDLDLINKIKKFLYGE